MTILMNDFRAEPQEIRNAALAAASRVLESGWYVLGPEVKAFEDVWAATCQLPHAVGVGNGMDAIEIGLRAMGIGSGDEVITTSMTAFATVLAILRAGATPVLADIDPGTALLDPVSARRCVSKKTKAVVIVHLYGRIGEMDKWEAFSRDTGVALVEDCAQAHLAAWEGRVAGSMGRFGAYSFYPTKNLGAPGDAGALVTADSELAALARSLRNYGQSERYHHPELGMNSRLDELQAAILMVRLEWLERFTKRRRQIAQTYWASIHNSALTLMTPPAHDANHVHHLFVVTTSERERAIEHFAAHDIQALIHYPIPVHHQKKTADLRRDSQGLGHTERHAATCLSLPCHAQMSESDVSQVVSAANAFW